MKTLHSNFAILTRRAFFLVALACLALPTIGHAQEDLDQLRVSGVLAERYDGYVVVREAGAGGEAVATRINAERSAIYQQRATEEGVTPDEIGRVYAAQIIKKAPAGTWFQNEDGSWIQR